jgi:DNA mismatch repair protein MutS2
MRPRDLVALDFPRVCARIADFAVSHAGREACHALAPTPEPAAAEERLERAWASFRLFEERGDPPLGEFADIRPHLGAAAHDGFVLDGKALVEIRHVLETARRVGAHFRRHVAETSPLAGLAARLRPCAMLESSLGRALDAEGNVVDRASDELAAVRSSIRGLRDTLTGRLEELVARPALADVLADDYVTLRNDRFVVPVRAAAVGRLPGVVQDRSISGESLFVEPLFAVELNNQLLLAVREEEAVVRRILADLTALVREDRREIAERLAGLIEVDVLLARARFARRYACSRPAFSTGSIELRGARHPGLLFTGRPVTPVDVILPEERRILVISGPNTGGKTVALKTLGLCTLMAQSGILIPAAEGARLPCVSAVFTDIGDEQNVERDLSTFSGHVLNLCEILAAAHGGRPEEGSRSAGDAQRSVPGVTGGAHGGHPLILLDEPGVGTDPEEGAALAVGLIEQLEEAGALLVVTTHFTPVKVFALGHPRCTVAAVEFDVETLSPGYRLVYHSLGQSLALPIAQRLGLPGEVLALARAARSVESRSFDEALGRLEAMRRELEGEIGRARQESAEIAGKEAEVERILAELRERRRAAWQTELGEARDFLRALEEEGRERLRSLQASGEGRAAFQRFLRRSGEAVAARAADASDPKHGDRSRISSRPLEPGDAVEVGERGIRGELLAVEGEHAWIQRGSLRFEVPAAELRRVARPVSPRPAVSVTAAGEEDAAEEIILVGLRAQEALRQLEGFLDHAVRAGHARVRIVHGVGSGALRRAVHQYLAGSPYCGAFRSAEPNEGGAGVTVAEMNG